MNYPDLNNLTLRKEWAEFVGANLERKAFPLIPYGLSGMSPSQLLDELKLRSNKQKHDKESVKAWLKWRFECSEVEGHNELTLRTALRAIQICDEDPDDLDELRGRIVRWLWDDWNIDADELAVALKDRVVFSMRKVQDRAAFPMKWRDPAGNLSRRRGPRTRVTEGALTVEGTSS